MTAWLLGFTLAVPPAGVLAAEFGRSPGVWLGLFWVGHCWSAAAGVA